jgi:hypothetical protein
MTSSCTKALAILILAVSAMSFPTAKYYTTASAHGKVYDTLGKPIRDAVVRVYRETELVTEATADEQSNFRFTGLPTGLFTFKVARKSGYGNSRSFDREVMLGSGQDKTVDLMALNIPDHWPPLKSEIDGIVMQSNKTLIEGARVTLIRPFYQQTIAEVVTGKDGRYHFTSSIQGQYVIQAFFPGFMVSSKNIIASEKRHSLDITLNNIP